MPQALKRFLGIGMLSLVLVGGGCAAKQSAQVDVQSSPEAVVTAFYDRLIADDRAGAKALVAAEAQEEDSFKRAWKRIENWQFLSAEIVEVSDTEVTVRMTVVVDGDEDTGTDQVTVRKIDEKWWIVEFPS